MTGETPGGRSDAVGHRQTAVGGWPFKSKRGWGLINTVHLMQGTGDARSTTQSRAILERPPVPICVLGTDNTREMLLWSPEGLNSTKAPADTEQLAGTEEGREEEPEIRAMKAAYRPPGGAQILA